MDRTILVTGANTGIGAAAAVQLAAPGTHLVLACRSAAKTAPVLERVRAAGARASFLPLALDDLAGAEAAGRAFVREHGTLDVLIANAGLAGQRGLTKDGWELAFGVNHLGHFAFAAPLLPLLEARSGRVVVVASGNHAKVSGIDFTRLREPGRGIALDAYGVSKLANVLWTAELRRRHPALAAVSLNPGRIASDIWRRVPQPFRAVLMVALRMKPVEAGGATLVHATQVELGPDAPLYFDKKVARPANPAALDPALAAKLWTFSEDAVRAAKEGATVGQAA
jgi:NAD(P)-dependent dehydrogenase (short-subunit alcohol dehydrogenase family)